MTDSSLEQPVVTRKKHRQPFLLLINLLFLAVIILAVNYIGCSRYERKDLTQDKRYTLSSQTLHLLASSKMAERKSPVKIIFAFRRNTLNYPRMRALLEDYVRYSDGKLELECVDPLRTPNRAREIANTYGIEFTQNMVIVDARNDVKIPLVTADNQVEDATHVRFLPGDSFIIYEKSEDGRINKAVALQMEDVVTSGLTGALEGIPKQLYIIVDKSRLGREQINDPTSLFATIEKITRQLNLQLVPMRISEVKAIPETAAGVVLIGPQYDLEANEIELLSNYWKLPNAGIFVMLDPVSGNLNNVFRFLRENGVRPRADRIMKKGTQRPVYEINAIFSAGPTFTKEFWNSSTLLEGQTTSLKVEEGNERLSLERINPFPLLETGTGYYGETKYTEPKPVFNAKEDYEGSLAIAAGVERGNSSDVNFSKATARMAVITNMDMLNPQKVRPDQRDFLKSTFFWITDREELAGIGTRNDLTVKIDWDEKAKAIIEIGATVLMPLLALFVGFVLWKMRRS